MTVASAGVSVVVIVLDGMPHLAAALDSIRDQPADLVAEIVVVDGGSTDGSAEHARSRSDVRVVPQLGRGIGNARNVGVASTTADLVAFLDSDDVWTAGSLALRLDALGDGDAVIGHVATVELAGEAVPPARRESLGSATIGYTPSALVARRSLLRSIGPFDETLTIGSDTEWLVRMLDTGVRPVVVDDVVALKGVRAGSLSVGVDQYRRELLGVARTHVRRRRGTT